MKSVFILTCIILFSCTIPQKSRNIKKNVKKDSPEYKMELARMTFSNGDFQKAEEMYLDIYNNTNIDQSFREEALFNLGMMYSNHAESSQDYEQALKYLRQLLSEFRKTMFREKANREIKYIRNQMKRMKK